MLLEKDPARRFQNPNELLKAIPMIADAIDAGHKITRQSLEKTPSTASRVLHLGAVHRSSDARYAIKRGGDIHRHLAYVLPPLRNDHERPSVDQKVIPDRHNLRGDV